MARLDSAARGVYVIAPTPFYDDGAIDFASIDRLVDFYAETGMTGITVLGQLGEAPKLDVSSLSPVVPAVAPVTSDDAGVEIALEDLIFEAEPPPPPKSELPSIPLFSSLDTEAFMALLKDAMDARVYAPGETVLKEGDPGDTMYALAQGTVEVLSRSELREVRGGHVGFFPFCGGFPIPFRKPHFGVYGVNGFFKCKKKVGFHF